MKFQFYFNVQSFNVLKNLLISSILYFILLKITYIDAHDVVFITGNDLAQTNQRLNEINQKQAQSQKNDNSSITFRLFNIFNKLSTKKTVRKQINVLFQIICFLIYFFVLSIFNINIRIIKI